MRSVPTASRAASWCWFTDSKAPATADTCARMAYAALEAGYATHRVNLRSCGGSESLALTNYHSGMTCDVLHILKERKRASGLPLFLAGFSLGGNLSLKLAGELGESGGELLAGVCAVSTPIDLASCAQAIGRMENYHLSQPLSGVPAGQDPAAMQAGAASLLGRTLEKGSHDLRFRRILHRARVRLRYGRQLLSDAIIESISG